MARFFPAIAAFSGVSLAGLALYPVLARDLDGFEIAEEDLRRRGMGDLDGLRQSGGGIDPEEDLDLLLAARDVVATHPALVEAYLADEAMKEKELSP
mgnify:CR=1 FL=1